MSSSYSPSTWSEGKSQALATSFLPLSGSNHKGSSGRIGVLGGSAQYTGAPFYAGMASLQAGADLAYIFCAEEAALAIKSYSPELMVAPVYQAADFDREASMMEQTTNKTQQQEKEASSESFDILVDKMVKQVVPYLDRLHVLVIGPGLGRCPLVFAATARIIEEAKAQNLALVLDADALFFLTVDEYKNILKEYENVVLTPNVVEYKRLIKAHADGNCEGTDRDQNDHGFLGKGSIMIKKGAEDEIIGQAKDSTVARSLMVCRETGGLKRSGGLGDILAGTVATFLGWQVILKSRGEQDEDKDRAMPCWSACCVTKRATNAAFEAKRRAMTAPDVLAEIGPAMIDMEAQE